MTMTRFHRTSVVMLAALACGCEGAAPPEPAAPPAANLYARVQLDAAGLHVAQIGTRADAAPFAAPGTAPLHYALLDGSGAALASGDVADPRLARFEAFDGSAGSWVVSNTGFGGATLALPAHAGTLVVRDATHELGRTNFDPDAPRPIRRAALPPVLGTVKVVDHGAAAGHLNLAILAEGYTAAQMDQFRAAAASFVAELQQTDGFAEHWSQINVWRIDVASQASGPGAGGVPNNTAFATAYDTGGIHRLLAMETQAGRDAATQLRQGVQADAAIVLVNSKDYGGSGDGGDVVSVIYAGDAGDGHGIASISAHELGHAIWHLADEYEDAALCDPANPPPLQPNFAYTPTLVGLSWARLLTPDVALPTTVDDPSVVGAYEGAAYCTTGRYRPQHDCRMRSLDHGYCVVCRDQIDQYFQRLGGGTTPDPGGGNPPTTIVPDAPTGLSPDGGIAVADPATLEWPGVPGADDYWVVFGHYAADGTFATDYYWDNNADTSRSLNIASGTSYAFAVDACNGTTCGAWSAYASFVAE